MTRLYNKIDELVDGEFDECMTTSLSNAIEKLTRKMEITQIDEQLLKTFDNASELESAVLDAEELHDDIMDETSRTRRYIELSSIKQLDRVSPVTQSSVES